MKTLGNMEDTGGALKAEARANDEPVGSWPPKECHGSCSEAFPPT